MNNQVDDENLQFFRSRGATSEYRAQHYYMSEIINFSTVPGRRTLFRICIVFMLHKRTLYCFIKMYASIYFPFLNRLSR